MLCFSYVCVHMQSNMKWDFFGIGRNSFFPLKSIVVVWIRNNHRDVEQGVSEFQWDLSTFLFLVNITCMWMHMSIDLALHAGYVWQESLAQWWEQEPLWETGCLPLIPTQRDHGKKGSLTSVLTESPVNSTFLCSCRFPQPFLYMFNFHFLYFSFQIVSFSSSNLHWKWNVFFSCLPSLTSSFGGRCLDISGAEGRPLLPPVWIKHR